MKEGAVLTRLQLERDGACLHRGLASAQLDDFETVLAKWPDGRAGVRIAGDPELARLLGPGGPVWGEARVDLGPDVRPVRAVLFDKNDRADWSLGWHQDRTIAVRRPAQVEGFGPWSIKQGIAHVELPFALIDVMLTARIHLDPVDADNAPLLIAAGSHRLGRVPAAQVEAVAGGLAVHVCLAEAGDVWFYRTAVLHASNAARPGRRRRVLQVDYAPRDLPAVLEWLGI
ncbi:MULTISPECIES: phytanoyl-CoA dioxygenase family protein [unclassified Novosphingobium]|uniref:phytanoyl-CoA dioxygenase family protein n=1 Tax=unclassified Novosphingobium TaxID=2644732 RepID=UPI001F489CF6|nr:MULTISPECIES: phytanoyl-CoA dioxygenase family protein [unclassified Novosphingobium]